MEGDQCYELWIDDVDTITFHENFDKEFFGKNVHLQNMCNLMSLGNLTPDGDEDDFDLEDYFFGDDNLPVENRTGQNGPWKHEWYVMVLVQEKCVIVMYFMLERWDCY